MAFAPTSYLNHQFEGFETQYLKFFQQGTVTPQALYNDANGTTAFAKIQINSDGFTETTGGAVIIPFVALDYDAWIFPTATEADNNDTINAIQIADNITIESIIGDGATVQSAISETQTLSAGQVRVTSIRIDFFNATIHVNHPSIDSRELFEGDDYTVIDVLNIDLIATFPNGTKIKMESIVTPTIDTTPDSSFNTDSARPKHAMTLDFSFSDVPNSGMQGFDYDDDDNLIYISQNIVPGGSSTHDPDEMVQLAVYDFKEDGSTVVPNSFTPQLNLGHGQDLSVTKEGSTIFLWTSAATPAGVSGDIIDYDGVTQSRANVDGGRFLARIEYKGNSTTDSDITTFRMIEDFDDLDDETWFNKLTPKISTCGEFIVVRFSNMRGAELPKIRVWKKSDIEAGTFTNFLADFFVPLFTHADGDIDVVQSVHLHENIIYVQMGGNSATDKKRMVRFTLNGALIDHYDFFADTSFLVSPPATVIEPEGQSFIVSGGKTRWASAFNISSASEVEKAIIVYGLGDPVLNDGDKRSPATLALDDATFDISVQDTETFNLVSYNYTTQIATSRMKLTSAFNVNFPLADHIRMKDDKVIRKDDLGAGRFSVLIRADEELANGAGLGLFASTDSTDPNEVHLNGSVVELLNLAGTEKVKIFWGTGDPEGVVTATRGSTFHRIDGGAGTSFYVKESDTTNTGWAAK